MPSSPCGIKVVRRVPFPASMPLTLSLPAGVTHAHGVASMESQRGQIRHLPCKGIPQPGSQGRVQRTVTCLGLHSKAWQRQDPCLLPKREFGWQAEEPGCPRLPIWNICRFRCQSAFTHAFHDDAEPRAAYSKTHRLGRLGPTEQEDWPAPSSILGSWGPTLSWTEKTGP